MYCTTSCTKASSMQKKLGSFYSLVFFLIYFSQGADEPGLRNGYLDVMVFVLVFFFQPKTVAKSGRRLIGEGKIVSCAQRIVEIISCCLFKKHELYFCKNNSISDCIFIVSNSLATLIQSSIQSER
ncbi:hypothetical protein VPH35_041837 [Triticum aestivum]|uniref:Uncharacterized protein n=1 Tax=Triticum turgidum subsp. durum TaxID=4567 RepID=A0A9R0R8S1_TRITD|nr:unnamed protein product [Triticum turgidum subsp. durum]